MGTHGPSFSPGEQLFSATQSIESQEPWSQDFYDDSILEFDKQMGDLVKYLTDKGLLDQTILIIASDHGQQWNQLKRVPLIVRFPNGEYAGRIQTNAQNLDIAPTIIDYLALDQPDWMAGKSLLNGELEQRPIFGVFAGNPEGVSTAGNTESEETTTSSTNNFVNISVVYCQKWFKLDFTNMSWESGIIETSTTKCPPGSEITDEQALQEIITHLQQNDFDVSTLDYLLQP
jgi:hypothetical protein